MADITPLQKPEEVLKSHQLIQLPQVELAGEQKAVDTVAVPVIKETAQIENAEFNHEASPTVPVSTGVIDRIAMETGIVSRKRGELPSIQGDRHTLAPKVVAKLMTVMTLAHDFVEETALDEKKESELDDLKRQRESDRTRKEEIADSIERRRAVLREVRSFLKKDDVEDHRGFLRALKQFSKEDRKEMTLAFQQMREDWRLFEGMSSLFEGRIEADLRGEKPLDS